MVTIGGKQVELKYTFNSFLYMEDLDVSTFELFESKPFKMIPVMRMLLTGAVNNDPNEFFNQREIQSFLESEIKSGNFVKLFEELTTLLQDSDFFKSLQVTETTTE